MGFLNPFLRTITSHRRGKLLIFCILVTCARSQNPTADYQYRDDYYNPSDGSQSSDEYSSSYSDDYRVEGDTTISTTTMPPLNGGVPLEDTNSVSGDISLGGQQDVIVGVPQTELNTEKEVDSSLSGNGSGGVPPGDSSDSDGVPPYQGDSSGATSPQDGVVGDGEVVVAPPPPQVALLDGPTGRMLMTNELKQNSYKYTNRNEGFISRCLAMKETPGPLQCKASLCSKPGSGLFDVSQLSKMTCSSNADCDTSVSGLTCHGGICLCPSLSGFNVTSCRCETTDTCVSGNRNCYKHNGRRCPDKFCSCKQSPNFSDLLIDTPSLFCLIPGAGQSYGVVDYSSPIYVAMWVVIAIAVLVFLILAGITAMQYGMMQQAAGLFQKGDYRCDNQDTVDLPEVHNATWDYPSMDYIHTQEEEIVFTLAQAKDFKGASNASTIHVIDENQTYELAEFSENHINKAYMVEGSVESVAVDDPRND